MMRSKISKTFTGLTSRPGLLAHFAANAASSDSPDFVRAPAATRALQRLLCPAAPSESAAAKDQRANPDQRRLGSGGRLLLRTKPPQVDRR